MADLSLASTMRQALDLQRSRTHSLRSVGRRAVLAAALAPNRLRRAGSRPDFVIVGAQRAGTTSLYHTLQQHPEVARLPLGMKGVHYFDTAGGRSLAWYRAHFPTDAERAEAEKAGRALVAGEASPYYLFHPTALERLDEAAPEVRAIIVLRDPVRRAISHHRHMVWEGTEDIDDLRAALDAETERLAGQEDLLRRDAAAVSPAHLHHAYVARSRYAPQVRRAMDIFGDRLLVVISEDLFAHPAVELARVAGFIDIDPTFEFDLMAANSSPGAAVDPETIDWLHEQLDPSTAELEDLLGRSLPWSRGRALAPPASGSEAS